MRNLFLLFFGVCLVNLSPLFSQTLRLEIILINPGVQTPDYRKSHSNQNELQSEITKSISTLHSSGYLATRIDSVTTDDSLMYKAFISPGNPIFIKQIRLNDDENLIPKIPDLEKWMAVSTTYNHQEILVFYKKILNQLENNGFPFATIQAEEINLENDSLEMIIKIEKGLYVQFDSIINFGNAKISIDYLSQFLSIKKGSAYNEALVSEIDAKTGNISFAAPRRPAEIEFRNNKALLRLFLDKKNANRFDGVAGIMPNTNSGGKALITGELDMRLVNSFGSGEQFEFSWRSVAENTSDLKTSILLPYFLGTRFGPEYRLKIFKKDTSWLSVDHYVGVRYNINNLSYFTGYTEWFKSDLISTVGFENTLIFPPYADIRINSFGLAMVIQNINRLQNPTKGYKLTTDISAGQKKIVKNSNINPLAYNQIKTETNRYKISSSLLTYIPIGKHSTVHCSLVYSLLQTENFFTNELYRLGGLKSLRGFDEESILASSYIYGLIEYRFLLDSRSFLAAFVNTAYIENKASTPVLYDTPLGAGLGLSFDTRAGIFSVYYAAGKQSQNPIDLKAAKIHFGFMNNF